MPPPSPSETPGSDGLDAGRPTPTDPVGAATSVGSVAGSDDEILERLLGWLRAGRPAALATVVATWGSSPRPVGSHLAVSVDREIVGSVSGGCVEGAVVEEAVAALEDGYPRTVEYGVADEEAWAVGLACGGRVRIHVAPLSRRADEVARLLEAQREGRSPVLVLDVGSGGVAVVDDPEAPPGPPVLRRAIRDAVQAHASAWAEEPDEHGTGGTFLRVYPPSPRLVVVGAVHIAQPLAALARVVGFRVVVVDPRAAFATAERFPGAEIVRAWPREGLEMIGPDARTAIVTLSHDPRLDDPALTAALEGPAFYVGALGSRRTHARRVERLAQAGVPERRLTRIHAPVGLDLGGRTPQEIALAILAEVVAHQHGRGPG